jgi:hypothetical protein
MKFDARIPGERRTVTTSTANTAPLEVAAGVVEDENGNYEVIQMEAKPRQKAYARIIAAGFPKVTLFDTGSQGDLMSLRFSSGTLSFPTAPSRADDRARRE